MFLTCTFGWIFFTRFLSFTQCIIIIIIVMLLMMFIRQRERERETVWENFYSVPVVFFFNLLFFWLPKWCLKFKITFHIASTVTAVSFNSMSIIILDSIIISDKVASETKQNKKMSFLFKILCFFLVSLPMLDCEVASSLFEKVIKISFLHSVFSV